MSTVADIFKQLGLVPWWDTSRVTQAFGENGEMGADYGMGGTGKPVGSITSGKVVYVGDAGYNHPGTSSLGQVVQILTPDGALIHYQHLKTSSVHLGQSIQTGQVVGTGGGCPTGAYYSDTSRSDCQWYDAWSSGQHIEVRYSPTYNPSGGIWGQNWLDPRNIFTGLSTKPANAPTNSPVANGSDGSNAGGAGGILPSLDLTSWGTKIGVFVLALIAVIFGFYIMFSKEVNQAVGTGVKTAAKAAVL